MLLSVIIPCYNVEPWLARCLDSVVGQDFDDMEIICVNDGSTDGTLSILRDYESRYPSLVRVIDKPNGGVSSARNAGIDAAQGRWLTFVDADDELVADSVARIMQKVSNAHDTEYILLGYKMIKGVDTVSLSEYADNIYRDKVAELLLNYLVSTLSSPWGKLYRREIVCDNEILFDECRRIYEDEKFNFDYFRHVHVVMTCSDFFYSYYVSHSDSASKKFYGDELPIVAEDMRCRRTKYFVSENELKEAENLISRDAAFIYLFAIYSIYRKKDVKGRYGWLKKYWKSATEGDSRWSFQLDSGFPKMVGKVGRLSRPLLHVMLSVVFAMEKFRKR